MAYELDPKTRFFLEDSAKSMIDYLDELVRIENESYEWGTPNVELAAAAARRSCMTLISAIQQWTGATTMAASGLVNPFVWLEHIATPDGTFILDAANVATEIVEELFKAHEHYHHGDTLKALEVVNKVYEQWGPDRVNVLIGAMRSQLLVDIDGSDQQPNINRHAPGSRAAQVAAAVTVAAAEHVQPSPDAG